MRVRHFLLSFFFVVPLMSQTVSEKARLSMKSDPSGAEVYLDSMRLGVTPFVQFPISPGEHRISLFYPSASPWGTISRRETLTFRGGDAAQKLVEFGASPFHASPSFGRGSLQDEVTVGDLSTNGSRRWATYASAGGMVISGIAAAYYKERANKRFDLYLETKNPSYLASTRRNDRRSAVALVFTQVGFALLTYFLLSE